MEVILLQNIENLGSLGDQVNVKSGYGRNYLIPQGKATEATAENRARFEARRAELERAAALTLNQAQSLGERLNGQVVTIAAKAGTEGRLFGSVTNADIAAALSHDDISLKKQEVLLPDGPIRNVGEYDIALKLHTNVSAEVRVNVVAE